MKVASLLLVVVVLLAGCASQPIESKYYLMRSQQDMVTRQLNPSRDFAIGTVVIASYIDQPGLLIETQSGEVRAARHHLWAEPVYESVHTELTVGIGQAKGEDILPASLSNAKTVIDIRIDQLHGTSDGKAKLVAYWWLRQDEDVVSVYQFAEEKSPCCRWLQRPGSR